MIQERLEHLVHQVHESGWGISQPQGHHQKLVMSIMSLESNLANILFSNLELMITGANINLREARSSLELIEQVINYWQGIFVMNSQSVELSIVYA